MINGKFSIFRVCHFLAKNPLGLKRPAKKIDLHISLRINGKFQILGFSSKILANQVDFWPLFGIKIFNKIFKIIALKYRAIKIVSYMANFQFSDFCPFHVQQNWLETASKKITLGSWTNCIQYIWIFINLITNIQLTKLIPSQHEQR